ncbi:hypothetical protein AB1A86_05790 [Stenotrophomonas maltophilia]|uniref:hypothetical protein n=1 Tax=Stenotrophomonas maltophilia TaxID=40324 RepID=UPI003453C108
MLKPVRSPDLATLPSSRGYSRDLERLQAAAARVQVTRNEAVRQVLAMYAAKPYPLSRRRLGGERDVRLAYLPLQRSVLEAVEQGAVNAGISTAEAVRQIIRDYVQGHLLRDQVRGRRHG